MSVKKLDDVCGLIVETISRSLGICLAIGLLVAVTLIIISTLSESIDNTQAFRNKAVQHADEIIDGHGK